MSDNWVVQNLENALNTWNEKLAEIWQLVTQSPEQFKGGTIWNVIVNIHGALQAIGLALLVLFFVVGVMRTCGNFAEVKKPEHALKLFIRFALAKGAVTYGLELMMALFKIVQGVISTIMNAAGFGTATQTVLPSEIVTAVEDCGFFESIPLWAVTLIGGLFITVLSFIMIMSVYGRFFKLYLYTAIAPVPLSAFAGEPSQSVGKSFIKSYAAVCLEGAIIVLACIIFSLFAATPPAVNPDAAAVTMVWSYVGELVSFTAKEEMTNIILTDPNADVIIIDPEREYSPLVKAMQGEVVHISATSENHINAMDMNSDYGDGANPVILKSEFILSLCEQLIGGASLGAKQKSIIDRCTASVYRYYQQGNYQGTPPTLQDFREELLKQDEPEAKEIALAIELFTDGSLNTFAKHTNVDTHSRLICYDILDLGKQLQPIGMLVVLDSILNRITQNRAKGRNTFIFIDEIYLLFQHEYSANFLFTLWKRVRKYGAYCTGITQNVDDLLQSHTARTMLANSEFIIMLNQASTDRIELAKLLNISDLQMSYITNVGAGQGLLKVGSSLVPFVNKFPRNTELYRLMTTKFGEV